MPTSPSSVACYYDISCIHIVPATPASNVCVVYDEVNRALRIIESTWNEVVCTWLAIIM